MTVSQLFLGLQQISMFSKQVAIVADDSVQVQRIVSHILKRDLHFGQVLVASNGKQAMQIFEAENVDWVFSDWEMPVMGGREFLEALRKHVRGRNVPFVLMTGYADKETLAAAIAGGITDFVAKPFSPTILAQKVRRIAAAMERRAAARIRPQGRYPAQIIFGGSTQYEAEMVDISTSGCLLRTCPLREGGTVCDIAKLVLKLDTNVVTVKGMATRIMLDKAEGAGPPNIQVAFQFQGNSNETQSAIKLFITQQQALESAQSGEEEVC